MRVISTALLTIVASLCTAPLEFVSQLFDLDMANLDAKFFNYFRADLMCRWFIFALCKQQKNLEKLIHPRLLNPNFFKP